MSPEFGTPEEALDHYWDAIVLGQERAEKGVDPMDVMALQQLQQHGHLPDLDAAFRRRLRRALLSTPSLPVSTSPSTFAVGDETLRAPGRVAPARQPQGLTRGSWRRWTVTRLATAALVLVTLIAGYVAFGLHHRREAAAPVVIPAIVGTPGANPTGITEDTILLQGTFDTIPEAADFSGVKHAVLQPGAVWPLGTNAQDGIGPFLYRVESGTLTITAEAPIQVTRAGSRQPQTVAARTEVFLEAGDQGFTPSGVRAEWRNDGTTPVSVLTVMVATDGMDPRPKGVQYDDVFVAWPMTPPPTPVQATLRRVTLSPQASLPGGPVPGLKLVGVESGTAELIVAALSPLATPTGSHRLTAPGSINVNTAQWSQIVEHLPDQHAGPEVIVGIDNPGPDPLTLLVLTVAPLTGPATPDAP